jgi:glutathione-specific gamma-glutamylcyclotransferase
MASARDLWVFGYGSLMWRPGFDFAGRHEAHVRGYHRALCVYSHVHRGTKERPGLVLGLDRGGSCKGVAFHVEADAAAATLAYLRARVRLVAQGTGISGTNPEYVKNTYRHLAELAICDKTLEWLAARFA